MRRLTLIERLLPALRGEPARSARSRARSNTRPNAKSGAGRGRRRPAGRAVRRHRRSGLRVTRELALKSAAGVAGLVVLAGLIGLIGSGWAGRKADQMADGLSRASATVGLAVGEVFVEGRSRTSREGLLAAVGVARGDPILGFDPQAVKSRVEGLPWVRRVTVERRLPSVIYLWIEERHPIALWQTDGRMTVIDDTGAVIAGARPEDFAGLTLVVGPDAPQHAQDLLRLLDREPELRERVVAAVRVGGRRWNLRFNGGTDVRLPETGAAEAWEQFARIERQHGVLRRDVDSIDLRLPDRLVVRTAPEAEQPAEKDDGKNT